MRCTDLFGNLLTAMEPNGIERQEARGQRTFVASETLPKEMNGCTKEQLESIGIKFHDDADDLFVNVTLPEGWKKVPTDHSMWSKLVDDKGRERASIFYKAAFYDRNAHISLSRRYSCMVEPEAGWESDYKKGRWVGRVTDCGKVIFEHPYILEVEPSYDPREVWMEWHTRKSALGEDCAEWLNEHYPEWRNATAYWA